MQHAAFAAGWFTRGVIILIAVVQIILGAIFLLAPSRFPRCWGFPRRLPGPTGCSPCSARERSVSHTAC